MKAAQFLTMGGNLEIVTIPIPTPDEDSVLIKVEACGMCHSDVFAKYGALNGGHFPMTPGHEVVGIVTQVGERVQRVKVGDRVGAGWHGGHCFVCDYCRDGDFMYCETTDHFTHGQASHGGYAEYMVARAESLAFVPEGISSSDAAPLMCAGVTCFNALRNAGIRPGGVVAVQGLGGLGHLGIQYAKKLGFTVVALSRGQDKRQLAMDLGADYYFDSKEQDVVAELKKLGGYDCLLCTAPNSSAISSVFKGSAKGGITLVIAAPQEPIEVSSFDMIGLQNSLCGWASGTGKDSEDTLKFSVHNGVSPMIETYSLEQVNEALGTVMDASARFRAVIVFE